MVRVAVRAPAAFGVNVILTMQMPPPDATTPEQVPPEDIAKSAAFVPVIVGVPEMVIDPDVPLVSVTVSGELVVFMSWLVVKFSGFGLTVTDADLPLPDRRTVGEPLLVWMVAVSGLAPSAGVNLIYTVHEPVKAESGFEALQAFRVWLASTL